MEGDLCMKINLQMDYNSVVSLHLQLYYMYVQRTVNIQNSLSTCYLFSISDRGLSTA